MNYKDKLKLAKDALESGSYDEKTIKYIFPELKESESEDERIRKEMISWLKGFIGEEEGCGYTEDEIRERIAWLEKQGEQKPIKCNKEWYEFIRWFVKERTDNYTLIPSDTDIHTWGNIILDHAKKELEKQGEKKPADKVEPKFKVGDWITNGIDTKKIIGIELKNEDYLFENGISDISLADNISHLWTIQDAKDGDVLVNQNGEMPFIFKECKNNHIYCYCGYTNRKDIFFNRFVDSEGEELHWLNLYYEQAYPATKEQRDTLEKAMTNAGYTFDFERKKLKKIEQKPADTEKGAKGNEREIPNSAWSEEDERKLQLLIAMCDETKGDSVTYSTMYREMEELKIWLESIKDRVRHQLHWEPSDEQMLAINTAINVIGKGTINGKYLIELHEQLKKLKA